MPARGELRGSLRLRGGRLRGVLVRRLLDVLLVLGALERRLLREPLELVVDVLEEEGAVLGALDVHLRRHVREGVAVQLELLERGELLERARELGDAVRAELEGGEVREAPKSGVERGEAIVGEVELLQRRALGHVERHLRHVVDARVQNLEVGEAPHGGWDVVEVVAAHVEDGEPAHVAEVERQRLETVVRHRERREPRHPRDAVGQKLKLVGVRHERLQRQHFENVVREVRDLIFGDEEHLEVDELEDRFGDNLKEVVVHREEAQLLQLRKLGRQRRESVVVEVERLERVGVPPQQLRSLRQRRGREIELRNLGVEEGDEREVAVRLAPEPVERRNELVAVEPERLQVDEVPHLHRHHRDLVVREVERLEVGQATNVRRDVHQTRVREVELRGVDVVKRNHRERVFCVEAVVRVRERVAVELQRLHVLELPKLFWHARDAGVVEVELLERRDGGDDKGEKLPERVERGVQALELGKLAELRRDARDLVEGDVEEAQIVEPRELGGERVELIAREAQLLERVNLQQAVRDLAELVLSEVKVREREPSEGSRERRELVVRRVNHCELRREPDGWVNLLEVVERDVENFQLWEQKVFCDGRHLVVRSVEHY
mmetsp:Transcript_9286/g.30655  ORF Transcript_9286/g.30655 Transcript_9286/m.30655 type:complete len:610 (-) Transcript_9286:1975-3804(-)